MSCPVTLVRKRGHHGHMREPCADATCKVSFEQRRMYERRATRTQEHLELPPPRASRTRQFRDCDASVAKRRLQTWRLLQRYDLEPDMTTHERGRERRKRRLSSAGSQAVDDMDHVERRALTVPCHARARVSGNRIGQ